MKTETEQKQAEWVSDLIGDDYMHWHNDAKILIDAGTGKGKTHFALNIYIDYCYHFNEKVLYLCNRVELYKKIRPQLEHLPGVTVSSYQAIQEIINSGGEPKHYDVIIADEYDFFWNDAGFNDFVDVSYNWLGSQMDSQIIFMSATGGPYFYILQNVFHISEKHVYKIPKDYNYIDTIYFYKVEYTKDGDIKTDELIQNINNMLMRPTGEKGLVFVRSMERLRDLRKIYGNKADYYAGTQQKEGWLNKSCISNDKFEKRLLITTTALGVGIDIKDRALKNIFIELSDFSNIVQAIGRKRPIDENDTCTIYFKNYDGRSFKNEQERKEKWVKQAELYLYDQQAFKDSFMDDGHGHTVNYRREIRENRIFEANKEGGYDVNMLRLEKFRLDAANAKACREVCKAREKYRDGYSVYLLPKIGIQLVDKERELIIGDELLDTFGNYLQTNFENERWYFGGKDQDELKDMFRMVGLEDTTMGINVLNGKLKDIGSEYALKSTRQRSVKKPNCGQYYWQIIKAS